MKYEIINPQGGYAVLKTRLAHGEEFYSMPGTVTSLHGVNFASQRKGGLLGGLKRSLLTGTNMYKDKLYFESDPGEAVVAPRFPGQIAEVQLEQDMFAHSHSFLAAENEVEIGSKSLGVRSLLANDTLFWVSLQRNPGKKVWLSFFGDVIKMDVKANERVSIEHGHFVAINADAKFNIRFLGIKRALLGGEGLYMVDIEGPAQVWLQTRNLEAFIQMVAAQVPRR
ncbi:hypothetical protein IX51_03720 [uncultured archaeon]|nr:hypothetical protein IX51_03720 [uncultured archaeon]